MSGKRNRNTVFDIFLDHEGYPAIKPPWGTLNAIDLNTGEYLWRVPLGEYPELMAQGLAPTGTENYGGPLVTAGGLVAEQARIDGEIAGLMNELEQLAQRTRAAIVIAHHFAKGDSASTTAVETAATAAEALTRTPSRTVYSAHEGSELAQWGSSKLQLVDGTHPTDLGFTCAADFLNTSS